MRATRLPRRRLTPGDREQQLASCAQALIARDGYAHFSLDEVAERADVTRNLIYRYFPRGRLDLFLAAVQLSGEELTGGWLTEPTLPFEQRLAANFGRMMEHARAPTAAWLVHRQARASTEPEIQAAMQPYLERVIGAVAQNHLGTSEPTPLARVAIGAYLAFAEHALDEARQRDLHPVELLPVLQATLVAAVAAAMAEPPA